MSDGVTDAHRANKALKEELAGPRWDPEADCKFATWSILDLIARYGETFSPQVQETLYVLQEQLIERPSGRTRPASGTAEDGDKGTRKSRK